MKYVASRLSDGNKLFPAQIELCSSGITIKIPGFFNGKSTFIPYEKISSVSVDTPFVGFSTIKFSTEGNNATAHGFKKNEVNEIKNKINRAKSRLVDEQIERSRPTIKKSIKKVASKKTKENQATENRPIVKEIITKQSISGEVEATENTKEIKIVPPPLPIKNTISESAVSRLKSFIKIVERERQEKQILPNGISNIFKQIKEKTKNTEDEPFDKFDLRIKDLILTYPIPYTPSEIWDFLTYAIPKSKFRGNIITKIALENYEHNKFVRDWRNRSLEIISNAKENHNENEKLMNELFRFELELSLSEVPTEK